MLATMYLEKVTILMSEGFAGVVTFLAHEVLSLVDAGEFLVGEAGIWGRYMAGDWDRCGGHATVLDAEESISCEDIGIAKESVQARTVRVGYNDIGNGE